MKKRTAFGAFAIALVLVLGTIVYTNSYEFPEHVDYGMVTIQADQVPLADVNTSTTSKSTTKTVKLKKKSKKTYTKTLAPKVANTTKTEESEGDLITVQTKTTTQVTEKYTKKKKTKKVTTKVTKTVTTTVEPVESENTDSTAPAAAPAPSSSASAGDVSMRSIAPKADEIVLSAYEYLGFKTVINPKATYLGKFSASNRSITLLKADESQYHELGHFMAFVSGNRDMTDEFLAIYKAEREFYDKYDYSYACSDPSEYFAASYDQYITDTDKLMETRPQTYAYIQASLEKITESRVTRLKTLYGWN